MRKGLGISFDGTTRTLNNHSSWRVQIAFLVIVYWSHKIYFCLVYMIASYSEIPSPVLMHIHTHEEPHVLYPMYVHRQIIFRTSKSKGCMSQNTMPKIYSYRFRRNLLLIYRLANKSFDHFKCGRRKLRSKQLSKLKGWAMKSIFTRQKAHLVGSLIIFAFCIVSC